jgi:hypothetical protein
MTSVFMDLDPLSTTITEDYRLVALLKKVKDIKQYEFSGRTTWRKTLAT